MYHAALAKLNINHSTIGRTHTWFVTSFQFDKRGKASSTSIWTKNRYNAETRLLETRFLWQHAAAAVVAYRTWHVQKKLLTTDNRRGVNGTRLRQWGLKGYTQVGVADTRYLSIDLSAEVGKKEPPTFWCAQAWWPSTYGRANSSFVYTTHYY